jgi:uncharacterized heparinase superfamily protein
MSRALRLWNTVRHLRLSQAYFQLYYRLGKGKVTARALASLPLCERRGWPLNWSAPLVMPPGLVQEGVFRFLGELGSVQAGQGWNATGKAKLWLYNLHYLDDLNAQGADERQEELNRLIACWTADNPPLAGDGWEPYPLSLRLVNLVKWHARQGRLPDAWFHSLARQAQALLAKVEWHILANHLFANGKALTFVGAFFAGPAGETWLQQGRRILDREVPEQFLPDGGHFELSPMYHATLLWDLCDLVNLSEVSGVPELARRAGEWRQAVARGVSWLQAMCHPDGDISFFNDAALGIAPTLAAIEGYAAMLGIRPTRVGVEAGVGCTHLPHSGYVAMEFAPAGKALLDVAQVGPSYQPGHAHADTLSFELSLHGQRVLVNSGTSVYGEGAVRLRQRGTAAHNTVEIDGQDSSEVWAGFRVARRAHPVGLEIQPGADRLLVRCAHDGYRWLSGSPRHTREWRFRPGRVEVVDRIDGVFRSAVARFHLHPAVQAEADNTLRLGSGHSLNWTVKGGDARLVPASWHPEFGTSLASHCLEVTFAGTEVTTEFFWE